MPTAAAAPEPPGCMMTGMWTITGKDEGNRGYPNIDPDTAAGDDRNVPRCRTPHGHPRDRRPGD